MQVSIIYNGDAPRRNQPRGGSSSSSPRTVLQRRSQVGAFGSKALRNWGTGTRNQSEGSKEVWIQHPQCLLRLGQLTWSLSNRRECILHLQNTGAKIKRSYAQGHTLSVNNKAYRTHLDVPRPQGSSFSTTGMLAVHDSFPPGSGDVRPM